MKLVVMRVDSNWKNSATLCSFEHFVVWHDVVVFDINRQRLIMVSYINPCGESDQSIVHLNFAKNG